MTDYGFGKAKLPESKKDKPTIDLSQMPRELPPLDINEEHEAVRRGEALGFTDRGQGATNRRRKSQITANLFIKGPEDVIKWFTNFTDKQGHTAYWRSISDFKKMVEAKEAAENEEKIAS